MSKMEHVVLRVSTRLCAPARPGLPHRGAPNGTQIHAVEQHAQRERVEHDLRRAGRDRRHRKAPALQSLVINDESAGAEE
jgi:hypothetical protein